MAILRAFRGLTFVLGAFWLAGCYSYHPVQTAPVGSEVRVRVPVGANPLRPNDPPQTVSMEGTLLAQGDTVVVATQTRRELGAYREIVQLDTLRLAASQISGIETKEFSTGRSVGLGVAIAAVVAGAAAIAFGVGGGSEGDGPPTGGGPETAVVISGSLLSSLIGAIAGGR